MSLFQVGLLGGVALVISFALAGCGGESGDGETYSAEVSLEEIPEAARRTILEKAGEHGLRELEEKVVNGETVYEAAWLSGGREIELVVAPSGEIVGMKGEPGAAGQPQVAASGEAGDGWRRSFDVDVKNLVSVGKNPYFPLVPGHVVHLSGGDETVVISVLDETKIVDGVETRIVEERESEDGELTEISRNYFATDKTTGDVYYFGEHVDIYEGGKVVGQEGEWLSGVDGAKFGLLVPGKPTVGDKFYQEVAPGQAMDRAEVVDLNATLETPLKTFSGVLYCRETTALDSSEVSHKWYAPGVGMIGDDDLRLVKVEEPPAK